MLSLTMRKDYWLKRATRGKRKYTRFEKPL